MEYILVLYVATFYSSKNVGKSLQFIYFLQCLSVHLPIASAESKTECPDGESNSDFRNHNAGY